MSTEGRSPQPYPGAVPVLVVAAAAPDLGFQRLTQSPPKRDNFATKIDSSSTSVLILPSFELKLSLDFTCALDTRKVGKVGGGTNFGETGLVM